MSGFKTFKGTLLGTPNREPQEYSKHIVGIYLPGSLYSIIFLPYSWGSPFGVPSRVPLALGLEPKELRTYNAGGGAQVFVLGDLGFGVSSWDLGFGVEGWGFGVEGWDLGFVVEGWDLGFGV